MSICRARLRNTYNALTFRMSSEQIRLQVSPPADDQAVNSRLLVQRQKMCCGKLAELTVDDIWQIAGAGDQQLQRLAHSSRRDTSEFGAEDNDGLSRLGFAGKQWIRIFGHGTIRIFTSTRHYVFIKKYNTPSAGVIDLTIN